VTESGELSYSSSCKVFTLVELLCARLEKTMSSNLILHLIDWTSRLFLLLLQNSKTIVHRASAFLV